MIGQLTGLENNMKKLYGYFMEPQNFSVNDGEGIRTIIFFAGCPLRCQWCANPEGIYVKNQFVKEYSIDELIRIIDRQEVFYRYSGGGVTFSGGEAALQRDVLRELTNILYNRAINLTIETSGYFEFDSVRDILEKLDLIFIDIKHMDAGKHKLFTGIGNEKILKNISRLNEVNDNVVVRIPIIDGVNSDDKNIEETARFVRTQIKNPKIELLPYHNFGDKKYEALGMEKPSRNFMRPPDRHINHLEEIVKAEGVEIVCYL